MNLISFEFENVSKKKTNNDLIIWSIKKVLFMTMRLVPGFIFYLLLHAYWLILLMYQNNGATKFDFKIQNLVKIWPNLPHMLRVIFYLFLGAKSYFSFFLFLLQSYF